MALEIKCTAELLNHRFPVYIENEVDANVCNGMSLLNYNALFLLHCYGIDVEQSKLAHIVSNLYLLNKENIKMTRNASEFKVSFSMVKRETFRYWQVGLENDWDILNKPKKN